MTVISVSSGRFKTKPLRKLFFPVLLKRSVRKRALRTLKEGVFFFLLVVMTGDGGFHLFIGFHRPLLACIKIPAFTKTSLQIPLEIK